MSKRIVRTFNRFGATRAVALDISQAFKELNMLIFFTNLRHGISDQIFGLTSFLINRWLCVVLYRKPSQEYPINA